MVPSQQQLAGSCEPLPASLFFPPFLDCLFQLSRVSAYIACCESTGFIERVKGPVSALKPLATTLNE